MGCKPRTRCNSEFGDLVISAQKTDPSTSQDLICWYRSCDYISARLLTKTKFEFTYGKVESAVKNGLRAGLVVSFLALGCQY